MIKQIDELYKDTLKQGKRVLEILISYIGYDHLKSELENKKEKPEWVDRLKVQAHFKGVKVVTEEDVI